MQYKQKKDPCPTCKITLRFCVGVPRLCQKRYERYLAKIAELKAKIEAEQAAETEAKTQ